MGIIGGTLAFLHFPRTSPDVTVPASLPDYGYDLIPYYCPSISIIGFRKKENVQSLVLLVLYLCILAAVFDRWNSARSGVIVVDVNGKLTTVYGQDNCVESDGLDSTTIQDGDVATRKIDDNMSNVTSKMSVLEFLTDSSGYDCSDDEECQSNMDDCSNGKEKSFVNCTQVVKIVRKSSGRLILQQLLHLNSLLFLARSTVVWLTGLPQPNPKCVKVQHDKVTYAQAYAYVMGRGFPPRACGDLIFSGHVGCILISMIVLYKHGYLRSRLVRAVAYAWATIGILSTISCRSHYTVDVVLAFYFSFGISDFYYARSYGLIPGGALGRWIRFLECDSSSDIEDLIQQIKGKQDQHKQQQDIEQQQQQLSLPHLGIVKNMFQRSRHVKKKI